MSSRRHDSSRLAASVSDEATIGDDGGHEFVYTWLSRALLLVAGLTLVAAVIVAAVHVDDRYRLDHVSGARMANAQYFNEGTLYPELYDGAYFGGTRWMPLPTILHGLLARATGEFLVSGKLLSYAGMAGLIAAMLWVMRRLRTPLPLALGLAVMPLVTITGWSALSDLRFEVLPLLLQLLAIEMVVRYSRRGTDVAAAGLAALALISKTSALWGPLAIAVWLLVRDRRRLLRFSISYAGFVGLAFLVLAAITDGRMLENVFGLSASGIGGLRSFIVAPYRTLDLLVSDAGAAWALLPVSGLAAWLAMRERRLPIYLVSLGFASVLLIAVVADIGTGRNQLVDVIVLSALVVGMLAGRVGAGDAVGPGASGATLAILLTLMVFWVDASGAVVTLGRDTGRALTGRDSFRSEPLAGIVTPESRILSEDPYIPVQLGQRPVVLDPFMMLRIGQRDPAAARALAQRIEDREFEVIALVEDLEPLDQRWWREFHFGSDIAEAIARSYDYDGRVQGYRIYTPQRTETAG